MSANQAVLEVKAEVVGNGQMKWICIPCKHAWLLKLGKVPTECPACGLRQFIDVNVRPVTAEDLRPALRLEDRECRDVTEGEGANEGRRVGTTRPTLQGGALGTMRPTDGEETTDTAQRVPTNEDGALGTTRPTQGGVNLEEWEVLTPKALGVPLAFSIRKAGTKRSERLSLSFGPELLQELRWKDGQVLEMRHKEGQFLLRPSTDGVGLKLTVGPGGRGQWVAAITGALVEPWAYEPCSLQPLRVVSMDPQALVFEVPQ